ncbi:MAG: ABC transporter substrate-binding protein, partial [Chloroflexota bacterium]
MLAERVHRGELPPVEQRLPETPYVVPHAWLTPGKYGGWMQWACTSADDWGTTHFIQESMYGHSPLRWLKDGLEIGPGLAEKW